MVLSHCIYNNLKIKYLDGVSGRKVKFEDISKPLTGLGDASITFGVEQKGFEGVGSGEASRLWLLSFVILDRSSPRVSSGTVGLDVKTCCS